MNTRGLACAMNRNPRLRPGRNVPNPSISTVVPRSKACVTIRATWGVRTQFGSFTWSLALFSRDCCRIESPSRGPSEKCPDREETRSVPCGCGPGDRARYDPLGRLPRQVRCGIPWPTVLQAVVFSFRTNDTSASAVPLVTAATGWSTKLLRLSRIEAVGGILSLVCAGWGNELFLFLA